MYRCLFIINPSSGQNVLQEKLDTLIGQLVLRKLVNHIDTFYTEKYLDAYNKALLVDEQFYDFLVVVGGDGTINEVIRGLASANKKIPLFLMAAGTVNDFANYLKLPKDVEGICKIIEDFYVIDSDIGKMNDVYFTNVCAAGMFSNIAYTVGKNEKKLLGPFAYYIQGFIDFPNQIQTNMKLSISFDSKETFDCDALLILIANTNRIGGFEDIMPQASIQDGLLDVFIVKKCNIADLAVIYKDYLMKKHIDSPFIIYKQVTSIDVLSYNDAGNIDIDGEDGGHFPIHASIYPQSIRLLVSK